MESSLRAVPPTAVHAASCRYRIPGGRAFYLEAAAYHMMISIDHQALIGLLFDGDRVRHTPHSTITKRLSASWNFPQMIPR